MGKTGSRMHAVQFEITKPTDDSAFEDMCARIYGELFGDPMPKINGRRGQAQGGVDIFVNSGAGRLGIQSKRYVDGALKLKLVEKELERADKMKLPIIKLVVVLLSIFMVQGTLAAETFDERDGTSLNKNYCDKGNDPRRRG